MSDETHIPVLSTRLHSGHSFPASFPKILRSIPGLNAAIAAGARTLKSDNAVIAAVSVTTVLSSYFNGCIGILLPAIQLDLDISNANLVWPASLYSLITACFLLVSGRLSGESHDLRSLALTLQADVYGRRLLFLVGTSIFALLSLAIALSSNFISLTVFTALLGFGPAAFTPAGTGILGSNLPPGKKKNIAFAILGAGQVLGYLGGLLLSSGFADNWRGAFYLQFGLASAALLLACLALPKNRAFLPWQSCHDTVRRGGTGTRSFD
jgi:MFS family permease